MTETSSDKRTFSKPVVTIATTVAGGISVWLLLNPVQLGQRADRDLATDNAAIHAEIGNLRGELGELRLKIGELTIRVEAGTGDRWTGTLETARQNLEDERWEQHDKDIARLEQVDRDIYQYLTEEKRVQDSK